MFNNVKNIQKQSSPIHAKYFIFSDVNINTGKPMYFFTTHTKSHFFLLNVAVIMLLCYYSCLTSF
jgi:hypothetical protein